MQSVPHIDFQFQITSPKVIIRLVVQGAQNAIQRINHYTIIVCFFCNCPRRFYNKPKPTRRIKQNAQTCHPTIKSCDLTSDFSRAFGCRWLQVPLPSSCCRFHFSHVVVSSSDCPFTLFSAVLVDPWFAQRWNQLSFPTVNKLVLNKTVTRLTCFSGAFLVKWLYESCYSPKLSSTTSSQIRWKIDLWPCLSLTTDHCLLPSFCFSVLS